MVEISQTLINQGVPKILSVVDMGKGEYKNATKIGDHAENKLKYT